MTEAELNHELIRVRGARENNLTGVDVDIPKRQLTVFTGVSGSGKSSLVFATIAAESQRLINETYSSFLQGFMPSMSRPEVDTLEGLTTAIVVGQDPMGANPRSTVGTVTDVGAMLRILFSRIGDPHIGSPQAFSFNVASISGAGAVTTTKGGKEVKERREFSITGGMCPHCEGRGAVSDIDVAEIVDESKSILEGAITVPGYSPDGWYGRIYSSQVPGDKPVEKFTKKQREELLFGAERKIKVDNVNLTYEGLVPRIKKTILAKDVESMQPHVRAFVERAVKFETCRECDGTRLTAAARSSKVNGLSIAEVCDAQISDLPEWLDGVTEEGVAPLVAAIGDTLRSFDEIGLGYLSLGRPSGTLSGGESQRVKMIKHLGSALTDVTYVFDEPTIGLHPHDIERMNALLGRLRDKGNTVLVVEHKPETISVADHVIDLGPGAGSAGGTIQYTGDVDGLRDSSTVTGRHLDDRVGLKDEVREPTGAIEVRGADTHNLQSVDVDIPLGVLVTVTGVAGSGKSSLIAGSVADRSGVIVVDQSAIKGSRRSSPATYTGALEPIRKAFAKANGVKPGLFSANSEGACPVCNGAGFISTELGPMATVESVCEECEGRRFGQSVLEHTLGGKNIADVLAMPVEEAATFFAEGDAKTPAAAKILDRLVDVGLGYVSLGQPLTTLSGGERQRLKLAVHLSKAPAKPDPENPTIYVLDEPTTGLHLADVDQLLALLDRLVDGGASVICVEHHQAVMAHSDWIIDLGPGAGHDGGQVVFTGIPRDLAGADTLTGNHLKRYLAT